MVTLLTRLRSLIWPSDPRRYCLSHKLVPEPCAVGLDEPRRRMWKMDRQNIFAGPGDLGEKLSPRPRGLRRIPVEDRRSIGLATLQGVVHEVADHDRVLSARADIDAAMVGRMAGRRHEPKRIVELIAVVDELSDDHFARRQIEDLGVKLREMAFAVNRVVGGEHLLRRPPRPVALDDADNGDVAD